MPNKKYCQGCGRAGTMMPYVSHFASSHHEGVKCSNCGSLAEPKAMSQGQARNIAQMYEERGPFGEKLMEKRRKDYDAEHGPGAWDRNVKAAIDVLFPSASDTVDKAVARVREE